MFSLTRNDATEKSWFIPSSFSLYDNSTRGSFSEDNSSGSLEEVNLKLSIGGNNGSFPLPCFLGRLRFCFLFLFTMPPFFDKSSKSGITGRNSSQIISLLKLMWFGG